MISTPRFELLQLIPLSVRDYIARVEPDLGTAVSAGWKARARSINQGKGSGNRIVFVPKGPIELGPAQDPGDHMPPVDASTPMRGRELASMKFRFVVYFWGYDPTDPRTPDQRTDDTGDTGDDMRHAARAVHLYERTVQALVHAAWGVNEWGVGDWTDTAKDRRHGAELWMPLVVKVAICDEPPKFARPVAGTYTKGPAPDTDS